MCLFFIIYNIYIYAYYSSILQYFFFNDDFFNYEFYFYLVIFLKS